MAFFDDRLSGWRRRRRRRRRRKAVVRSSPDGSDNYEDTDNVEQNCFHVRQFSSTCQLSCGTITWRIILCEQRIQHNVEENCSTCGTISLHNNCCAEQFSGNILWANNINNVEKYQQCEDFCCVEEKLMWSKCAPHRLFCSTDDIRRKCDNYHVCADADADLNICIPDYSDELHIGHQPVWLRGGCKKT